MTVEHTGGSYPITTETALIQSRSSDRGVLSNPLLERCYPIVRCCVHGARISIYVLLFISKASLTASKNMTKDPLGEMICCSISQQIYQWYFYSILKSRYSLDQKTYVFPAPLSCKCLWLGSTLFAELEMSDQSIKV